jgi:hypothetical protein
LDLKVTHFILFLLLPVAVFAQKPVWQSVVVSESEEGITHCNQVIKTQDSGYVLTGFFDHEIKLADTTIYTVGGQDGFVVKLNSKWQLDWVHCLSGPGDNAGLGAVELTSGNIVVGGKFYDSIAVAGSQHFSRGGCDIVLLCLDPSGNLLWAKSAGGQGDDFIGIGRLGYTSGGMAKGVNDNIYITGAFGDNNYSPPLQYDAVFDSTQITSERGADMFLAKYRSNGKLNWVKAAGGMSHDIGIGISTGYNTIGLTGIFLGPWIMFDSTKLLTKESSFSDMYVAIYDTAGSFLWSKGAGNFNPVGGGASCTLDTNKSVYVTGYYFDDALDFGSYVLPSIGDFDMYVAKYDSNGIFQWARNGGGGSSDVGQCIAIDGNNIYLSGFYSYDAIFGNDTVLGNKRDLFLTQLDEDGNYQWIVTAEGSGDETPFDILVVDENEIYVSGYFDSPSVTFGNITVHNAGDRNFFIAKLGPDTTSTGIEEQDISNQLQVYPNPIKEGTEVTVQFAHRRYQAMVVHDLQGKEIMRTKILPAASTTTIDVSDWSKGIYFIRLYGEEGKATTPLIKN